MSDFNDLEGQMNPTKNPADSSNMNINITDGNLLKSPTYQSHREEEKFDMTLGLRGNFDYDNQNTKVGSEEREKGQLLRQTPKGQANEEKGTQQNDTMKGSGTNIQQQPVEGAVAEAEGQSSNKKEGAQTKSQQWWIMDIGKPQENLSDISEYIKPTDHDVYPLSVYYEETEKTQMKIYRMLTLCICIFALIPSDIYRSRYHGFRMGYFDNDEFQWQIQINQIEDSQLFFNLTNINVYWFTSPPTNDQSTLFFDLSVMYGVSPTINNNSYIEITCPDTSVIRCILNMYIPSNNSQYLYMPTFFYNFTGNAPQLFFEDLGMQSAVVNFGPNNLTIIGNSALINLNNHVMSTIFIDLDTKGYVRFQNLRAQNKIIAIQSGLYNEYLPSEYINNNVSLYQPYGLICLYAPLVQNVSVDPSCGLNTNVTSLFLPSVLGALDPSQQCSTQVYMSQNPATDFKLVTFDSNIQIILIDGPIQIRHSNQMTYLQPQQAISYLPNYITTSLSTQVNLNNTATYLNQGTSDDKVIVLQSIGIDYERSWIYCTTLPYVQAQIWPLSWASLTLLQPIIQYQPVVLIDSYCPARGENIAMDSDVFDYYTLYFPVTSISIVAVVNDFSQFYWIQKSVLGSYTYRKINFNDNVLIVAAFIVSGLISLLGSAILVMTFIQVAKLGKKFYQDYIQTQRKLAQTKEHAMNLSTVSSAASYASTFSASKQIVEYRGVFTTDFDTLPVGQKGKQLDYQFSIFQVPALYVDYIFRSKANSLRAFLIHIPENHFQFTSKKMKAGNKSEVSILRSDFEQIYQNFCQRFGYTDLNLDAQKATLEEFQLVLDTQTIKEVPAYVNIRLKTKRELAKQGAELGSSKEMSSQSSSISQFLDAMCVQSQFVTDYIQFQELTNEFEHFCEQQNRPLSDRQQIIGCEELKTFGAVIRKVRPPDYILGLKFSNADNNTGKYTTGMIRKPINYKNVPFINRISIQVRSRLRDVSGTSGFAANAAIVVLHFILLVMLPLSITAVAFLGFSEMTRYQGDPFAVPVTFADIVYANSLDPWWLRIQNIEAFECIHFFTAVYYLFAFAELVSYYFTGYDNQGKFPVIYSIPKRIIVYGFQLCLAIMFVLYFAMICMFLTWAILAAILNPTKFLPYAAASLTFMVVILVRYQSLKHKYKMMQRKLEHVVNNTLNNLVAQSMQRLKRMKAIYGASKKKGKPAASLTSGANFQSEMVDFITTNNQLVAYENQGQTTWSNLKELTKIASTVLNGLQPTIIEAAIAIQTDHKMQIIESLKKLSLEFKMDPELIECVAELALSEYNPDKFGIREPHGLVVVTIKRLFRRLFPQLNVELIGNLLGIVAEGDSRHLTEFLKQFAIIQKEEVYVELFYVIIYTLFEDKKKLQEHLLKFQKKICTPEINQIFEVLYYFQEGQIKMFAEKLNSQIQLNNARAAKQKGKDQTPGQSKKEGKQEAEQIKKEDFFQIANDFGFQYHFPVLSMMAFSQRSNTLSRFVIQKIFHELQIIKSIEFKYESPDQEQQESEQGVTSQAEGLYLALFQILKGGLIDMRRVCAVSLNGEVDVEMVEALHLVSHGSKASYEDIINRLNCAQSKDILLEFYSIIQKKNIRSIEFCQKLKIDSGKSKAVTQLIQLLYRIFKYEILAKRFGIIKGSDSSQPQKQKSSKARIQFGILKGEILENLKALSDSEGFRITEYESLAHLKKADAENMNAREVNESSENQSQADGTEEKKSQGAESAEENMYSEMDGAGIGKEASEQIKMQQDTKTIISNIFSMTGGPKAKDQTKENYQLLTDAIICDDKLKENLLMNDNIKSMVRCYAVMLLRREQLLEQTDVFYLKCLRTLADLFELQSEKFEFLLDIVSGHPLEIYKATPKEATYNIKTSTINADLDSTRFNMIMDLINGDRQLCLKLCIIWYHQYKFYKQGLDSMPLFMRTFNIRNEFVNTLEMNRHNQRDDHSTFGMKEFTDKITRQLEKGLERMMKSEGNKIKQDVYNEEKLFITNQYFSTKDKFMSQNITKPVIKDYEEIFEAPVNLQKGPTASKVQVAIMQRLLKLKQGDKNILFEIVYGKRKPASDDKKKFQYIQILRAILDISTYYSPNRLLNSLLQLSKSIPLFQKDRPVEEWEAGKMCSIRSQNLFVQFALVLNCYQFQNECRDTNIDEFFMNQSIKSIIEVCNKSNTQQGFQKIEISDEKDFYNIVQSLYDQMYFRDIAVQLFCRISDYKISVSQCNNFLGVFLGATLENPTLMRHALINLLQGHELKLGFLNGLGAALQADLEDEDDIKNLAKQLDLDDQLLINIIDLVNDNPKKLPSIIFDLLAKNAPDQIQLCTSLIYTIKKDVVNVKPIALKLGVEPQMLIPVLAAAVGNTQILQEFYKDLADKFGIMNQKSIRYTLELASGETSCLYVLSQKKSKEFYVFEPELVEACLFITKTGAAKYGGDSNAQSIGATQGQLEGALGIITKKFKKAFKLEKYADSLQYGLSMVVNSCWGDYASLRILYGLMKQKSKFSIWQRKEDYDSGVREPENVQTYFELETNLDPQFLDKFRALSKPMKIKFLEAKFNTISVDYDNREDKIRDKQKELIKILRTRLLPSLEDLATQKKGESWDQVTEIKFREDLEHYYHIEKPEEREIVERLPNQVLKVAYQIGCTFGMQLFKSVAQPFFYCIDCNVEAEDESLGICYMCMLFCHKDHRVKPGNYGLHTKIICDCGQGKTNGCSGINSSCPIESRKGLKTCSVLRWNFKLVQQQINEDMAKADLKKRNEHIKKDKAGVLDKAKNEEEEINRLLVYYSNDQFFVDLGNATNIKYIATSTVPKRLKDPEGKNQIFIRERKDLGKMRDDYLDRFISLIENFILFANGRATNSFLTILAAKKKYNYEDHQTQQIYKHFKKDADDGDTRIAIYNALCCFIGISQGNFSKFHQFGPGYCNILGVVGTKEETATEKIINILRLAKGGKLSSYKQMMDEQSQVDKQRDEKKQGQKKELDVKNAGGAEKKPVGGAAQKKQDKKSKPVYKAKSGYEKMFQRLFGIHGKKVIILHKLLTLQENDMTKIMSIIDSGNKNSKIEDAHEQEIHNLYNWIDAELFTNVLELDSKSKQWVKSIIRLCNDDFDAFDFIAQERKIHPLKASMYKAILTKNEKDLVQIFDNLKPYIPFNLNKLLLKVWQFDRKSIIEFFQVYLEIDNGPFKIWKSFHKEMDKIKANDTNKKMRVYLYNLYSVMMSESMKMEEKIYSILSVVLDYRQYDQFAIIEFFQKKLDMKLFGKQQTIKKNNIFHFGKDEEDNKIQSFDEKLRRMVHAVVAVHGMVYENITEIPKIVKYMDLDKRAIEYNNNLPQPAKLQDKHILLEDIVFSLIQLSNQSWQKEDLGMILQSISTISEIRKHAKVDSETFDNAKHFLQASEGDLISFGKLMDEFLSEDTNTHLHSLLVSLLTGNTKFDHLVTAKEKNIEEQKQMGSTLGGGQMIMTTADKQSILAGDDQNDQTVDKIYIDPLSCQNLLKREIYRIFEQIYRIQFNKIKESDDYMNNYIKFCFEQKVPLHFMMIMGEDIGTMNKFFSPVEEFQHNLVSEKQNAKDSFKANKQYLLTLLDFLDPFTVTQYAKPLLRYIFSKPKWLLKADPSKIMKADGKSDDLIIKINKLKGADFKRYESLKLKVIDINLTEKDQILIANLEAELKIKNSPDHIQIDMIQLFQMIFNAFKVDKRTVMSMYTVFDKLFENVPILQNILNLVFKLLKERKYEVFENIKSVISIIAAIFKFQVVQDASKIEFSPADVLMTEAIALWLQGIIVLLNKENKFEEHEVDKLFNDMITKTLEYYKVLSEENKLKNKNEAEIVSYVENHALASKKDNVPYMVDVIHGIMNMCKDEMEGIEKMALKIGGFPTQNVDKLDAFFRIIVKYSDVVNKQVSTDASGQTKAIAGEAAGGEAGSNEQDQLDQKLGDKELFIHFAQENRNFVSIDEFKNVVKTMNIKISESTILRIFSKADSTRTGQLTYQNFKKALLNLKILVIERAIESMGVSLHDLVTIFIMGIVLMLMLFIFIFIGICAFSPNTPFTAVINSFLVTSSGMNPSDDGKSEGDDNQADHEEAVNNELGQTDSAAAEHAGE